MKIHPSPDCLVPTMPSRRNRLQADCEPPTEQDPICCKPSTFTKTMANVWTFYLTTSHTGNFAKCKPFEKVALIFLSLPLSRATKPTPPILFCYSRAHICHEYRESYWWRKSCHVEKFWDILGNFVHLWRKNDKYEVCAPYVQWALTLKTYIVCSAIKRSSSGTLLLLE